MAAHKALNLEAMGQYHYSPPLGIVFFLSFPALGMCAEKHGAETTCRTIKKPVIDTHGRISRCGAVVARLAHNQKVISANLITATKSISRLYAKLNMRWNNTKQEISLSPAAVSIINRLLSNGEEVKIDVNQKTHELMIFKVPRKRMEYKVVIAERR